MASCTWSMPMIGISACPRVSHVSGGASEHHHVAVAVAQPDLAMVRVLVDERAFEDRGGQRPGAAHGAVEVVDLEPEQDAVAMGGEIGISHVRVLVGVPGV